MKISIVQMDMKFANPDYNFEHVENLIRSASEKNPDIITLPETWNTGFFPTSDLKAYCDNDGVNVKDRIGKLAKELDVNIVAGSVANIKNDKVYNTSYIFKRDGACVAEYDKIHLFSPMGENDYFESGNSVVTFMLEGIKCGIIICYDVRFLELVRTLTLKGIDLLFVVAQWPDVRVNHWQILNKARAIENQIFVVSTNSCGIAGETKFGGYSSAIDPFGNVLTEADGTEQIITAELDMEILENIRSSINVFQDRKPSVYDLI